MIDIDLKRTGESIDGLLRGKVRVIQATRGYRVSEDAVILSWFTRPQPEEMILDAGTGCGAIAFGLAVMEPRSRVIGLEIQKGLTDRAGRGVKLNQLEGRVTMVRGDLRQADSLFRNRAFDVVVSNPPYHEPGRGRVSCHTEKALSRHQLMMPLVDLFRVAAQLLKEHGRLSLIYPASGADCMATAMKDTGFSASRMVWIHPHHRAEPGLVCLEARPQSSCPGLVEERLVLYRAPGERTPQAEAIMAGEAVP